MNTLTFKLLVVNRFDNVIPFDVCENIKKFMLVSKFDKFKNVVKEITREPTRVNCCNTCGEYIEASYNSKFSKLYFMRETIINEKYTYKYNYRYEDLSFEELYEIEQFKYIVNKQIACTCEGVEYRWDYLLDEEY